MWEKLERNEVLFLLIDLQEKFYPLIEKQVLKNAKDNILLTINMAKKLGIPMIGTEHCVKNLGTTDRDVLEIWEGPKFTDKVTFSCLGDDAFVNNLEKSGKQIIVVAGLETHICVLQTVIDLIERGNTVIVLSDGCLSSSRLKWENGLELIKQTGAYVLNAETFLFYLLKRADTVEFKYMVKLLKKLQCNK